jgi:hypothetical protein
LTNSTQFNLIRRVSSNCNSKCAMHYYYYSHRAALESCLPKHLGVRTYVSFAALTRHDLSTGGQEKKSSQCGFHTRNDDHISAVVPAQVAPEYNTKMPSALRTRNPRCRAACYFCIAPSLFTQVILDSQKLAMLQYYFHFLCFLLVQIVLVLLHK